MSDVPVLVGIVGPAKGRSFPVEGHGLKIGRADDNDVVITGDDGVSRYHATLLFQSGTLWLRDAGSRNGVYVNDRRVTDHKALSVRDRVRVGDSVFEVRWKGDEGGEEPAPPSPEKPKRWKLWPFE